MKYRAAVQAGIPERIVREEYWSQSTYFLLAVGENLENLSRSIKERNSLDRDNVEKLMHNVHLFKS